MISFENDSMLKEDIQQCAASWKHYHNQTFFVTGATGLVGSMIVKSIIYANEVFNCNNRVIAAVRNTEKLRRVLGPFMEQDGLIAEEISLEKPIHSEFDVDYLIHCASPTASKFFVTNPVETISVAVNGTLHVLQFAAEKKVKAAVYLSSMEMYGNVQKEERTDETQLGIIDVLNIRSSYSEGKRLCECLCASFVNEYQVPVRIARLAQTFGAGVPESDNRVFAQFSKCALNQQDIVLHTDGTSFGNYCYTSDVICGIAVILEKGKSGEAYNIVNEETTIQIRDMAQMVCEKIADNAIKVVFDIPEDSLKYGYAPPTRLRLSSKKLTTLGWKPTYNLEEMYIRTIQSYKDRDIR